MSKDLSADEYLHRTGAVAGSGSTGGLSRHLSEGGRLEHAAGDGLRRTAENRVRTGRSGRFVPDFYDFTASINDPACLQMA